MYSVGGNITSVKTYNGSTLESTDIYSYTDTNWPDKLTAYNNVPFTYDSLGNPLSYYNGTSYTFTWKDGRRLATLSTGTISVTYNYNADSVRIKKTVNGVVHEYVVDGYKILEEKYGTTVLKFTYDENDSPQSINYNGTTYYYGKNLQGDIVKLYDSNGNAIAEYTYDAWGNTVSTMYSNVMGLWMLGVNPFRYRGYYYDFESGLYYLNSRYYDAKVGRFINADDVGILDSAIVEDIFNLYCYCNNMFIIKIDHTGNFSVFINPLKGMIQYIPVISCISSGWVNSSRIMGLAVSNYLYKNKRVPVCCPINERDFLSLWSMFVTDCLIIHTHGNYDGLSTENNENEIRRIISLNGIKKMSKNTNIKNVIITACNVAGGNIYNNIACEISKKISSEGYVIASIGTVKGGSVNFTTENMWVVYQSGRVIYYFNNKTITMRIAVDFFKIYKRLRVRQRHFPIDIF